MKYVASLISGVGIFCVGTGLSFYHGVTGLLNPMPMESFYWVRLLCMGIFSSAWMLSENWNEVSPCVNFTSFQAFFILGGSLVSEGATLLVAVNSIRKGARQNKMTFTEYGILSKAVDFSMCL
jgi:zinc transporter 9